MRAVSLRGFEEDSDRTGFLIKQLEKFGFAFKISVKMQVLNMFSANKVYH